MSIGPAHRRALRALKSCPFRMGYRGTSFVSVEPLPDVERQRISRALMSGLVDRGLARVSDDIGWKCWVAEITPQGRKSLEDAA